MIASGELVIKVFLPLTVIEAEPFTTSIPTSPFAIALCAIKPKDNAEIKAEIGFKLKNRFTPEVALVSVT